ncbi:MULTISPECIES: transposase [unclassified Kaistella]|uniref:REP-associated tyrosine transposase n=1 Tax=unclassified Kaistella TaxID=2762626 RepID=UPI002734E903|nr:MULTISPECIES: transposase [unclassified Kaistella]MDP2453818.1 transposase [Kaistella sp. SH11-4b]MDP2456875.1 transposase [Kaistella sp. SH40-3]MDP2459632.1 transposase [Kaistella sp. SH19-2b]
MKDGYLIRDQEKPHFITCTVVDWIDVFTRKNYRDIVISSLQYCIKEKGMLLYGYVIMSNHLHLIVQSKDAKLSDLIRAFKKYTAKNILETIQSEPESRREWMLERFKKATETHGRNKTYQFWQYGNHAEEIYTLPFLWGKLNYIHFNPIRAGWVEKAQHYIYSSASNYVLGKGLVNIELADPPMINTAKTSEFWIYNSYEE